MGLVLGAGGVVGGAWLAGALAAIAEATRWQPQRADVLLGTSAGAVLAALLGAGFGPNRLFASATAAPEAAADAEVLLATLMRESSYQTPRGRPRLLPGSLSLAASALRRRALLPLLCGLVPRGPLATTTIESAIRHVVPAGWAPHPACWVVACDYGTGRRAVFGRPDAPVASLSQGVAASCAIPGFFRPVGIGGRWYVDGGVRSMSNADVLAGERLDLVVVLNPMWCRVPVRRWSPVHRIAAAWRAWSARRIDAELEALRRRGVSALLLEPTAEDLEAMGTNVMDAGRAGAVATLARQTAAAQLRRPSAQRSLGLLAAA